MIGTPDMSPQITVNSHLPEAGASLPQLLNFDLHSTIFSFLCWKVPV